MLKQIISKFARRPFPSNWNALRSCRISYSQFGEDLFLTSLLGYETVNGVYVDIGCFHPINFSNTYIFYRRGWRGIAVDPNPRWAKDWKRYRPNDEYINSGVARSAGTMSYIMNNRFPECNRLAEKVPAAISPDETVTTVSTICLNDVLKRLNKPRIDLLNIDCEGYDFEILRTLDFSRWKPFVIAAEDEMIGTASPLCSLVESNGYTCKAHIGLTKIFCLS